MNKLVIPKGCELVGEIQSIVNTGDIVIRTPIGARQLISKEGSVVYEVEDSVQVEVLEAAEELSVSASELHCGSMTAKTMAITADVLDAGRNLEVREDLALVCGEIRAKEIRGQFLTIKANNLKAERIEGEQVEITAGSATLKEIKAKRVVLTGVIQCNRIIADELVRVESGKVAIRNVKAPSFIAGPKVTGIVMVATCDEVRAEGVRGFLHPSEISMLSGEGLMDVVAPTVPMVTTADLDETDPDIGVSEVASEVAPPVPEPAAPVEEDGSPAPALSEEVVDEWATRDMSAVGDLPNKDASPRTDLGEVAETEIPDDEFEEMADTFSEREEEMTAADLVEDTLGGDENEFEDIPELASVDLDEELGEIDPGPTFADDPDQEEEAEQPHADFGEEPVLGEVAELPVAGEEVAELPGDLEEEVAELPGDLEEEVAELPSADLEEEDDFEELAELPGTDFQDEAEFGEVVKLPGADLGEEPDFGDVTELSSEDLEAEEEVGALPNSDFETDVEDIAELPSPDIAETGFGEVVPMPGSGGTMGADNSIGLPESSDFSEEEEEELDDVVSIDDLESFDPGSANRFPQEQSNPFADISTRDAIQVNTDDFTDVDELDDSSPIGMDEPDTLVEEELYDLDGPVEEEFEETTDVLDEEEVEELEELGDEELSDPFEESLMDLPPQQEQAAPVVEEDPEVALIARLNGILDQIRGFFPEDNYPQSIDQIRGYLDNKQLNLFKRARNRESVIKNFQKFQHEEINVLVVRFFEMMDGFFP